MDLPLYKLSSTTPSPITDTLEQSPLSSAPTAGISVLAGKVVKYLLTRRGTDLMSPKYGCYLMNYTQIPRANIPQFQLELISTISSCTQYIKSTESDALDSAKRLKSIELTNLLYNRGDVKDQIDLFLKITNISGDTIILNVPVQSS